MSQSRAVRTRITMVAAVAAASVLTLTACSGGDAGSASGDTKFVQGTGEISTVPQGKRQAAPDIEGKSLDGERLKLSDHRGKVVVLNVWGSWCSPCRAEAPNLAKVAKESDPKDVQFLGINTRDPDKAQAKAFERNFGVEYPSYYDPDSKLILKFPKNSLSPQAIPSTLVLDREGRIAARALKELSEKELQDALKPVVEEDGGK